VVKWLSRLLWRSPRSPGTEPTPRNAWCSFCRRSYIDAGPLAEGPDLVLICGKCAALCLSIIEKEQARRERNTTDVRNE
jgi:ATP-dependent Clp protease ATP-binding subunit ClpX